MQDPPFIVGKPALGEYFVDREDEMRRLITLIEGVRRKASSNAVLIGLRRTGKTSVLQNVISQLEQDAKIIPLIVNCYGLGSKSRLAKMLVDNAIENYVGKTGEKAYLRRLRKIINETAESTTGMISEIRLADFSLKLRDHKSEDDSLVEEALQYIETLAEEKDVFFVVMLDEFQDVIRWGEDTLKRIRVVVQSQNRVCYVFTGSSTTMMHDLVYSSRSPFYRQLVEVQVKKLDRKLAGEFVKRRLSLANIRASEKVIDLIVLLSDGYPDYVQRLGLELYLSIGEGGPISEDEVKKAYEGMVISLDGEFDNYFSMFSPLEREILVALANGRIRPSEVAREVRKPLANISKTLTMLVNYGTIEKPMAGQYRISDPVFCDWLIRRFKTIS
jgi:AAA+ ATPase superfamily predicted ATPase